MGFWSGSSVTLSESHVVNSCCCLHFGQVIVVALTRLIEEVESDEQKFHPAKPQSKNCSCVTTR